MRSLEKHTIFAPLIAVMGWVGFASSGLGGQRAIVRSVTLSEAVILATAQNPNVEIAILDSALAGEAQQRAFANLLPQVSVGTGDIVRRINVETSIGTTAGLSIHEGPYPDLTAGTRFSIPLFNLSNIERYRAQRAYTAAANADAKAVREQITEATVAQYLLCIRLAAANKAAESEVNLAQRLSDQAVHQEQAGTGTSLDTLRARQKLKVQQQTVIVACEQEETALFLLVRLLNLPSATVLSLADVGRFESRFAPLPDETAIEAALADRAEMIALKHRIQAGYRELASTKAERLPSVNADGEWCEEGVQPDRSIPTYQAGISVSIPVFTGGLIRSKIAAASLQIDRLKQQQEDLKNQIALEVKTATTRLQAALKEVDVADAGLNLAKAEVAQAQDRFASGASDNIEVVTAQDTLARAYDDQIAALYKANKSRADLARALGHIEDTYKE